MARVKKHIEVKGKIYTYDRAQTAKFNREHESKGRSRRQRRAQALRGARSSRPRYFNKLVQALKQNAMSEDDIKSFIKEYRPHADTQELQNRLQGAIIRLSMIKPEGGELIKDAEGRFVINTPKASEEVAEVVAPPQVTTEVATEEAPKKAPRRKKEATLPAAQASVAFFGPTA